jgi:hypothetical protein
MSKAFAAVGTLPKSDRKVLNPRATRYGLLPIWPVATSSRDFYVWEIPANTVFPFRPFIGEVGQDINGNVLYTTERMPNDQILDMYSLSQFFTELEPLNKLGDEEKAQQVADVLMNPTICEKYPTELGHQCATCWFKDSLTNMEDRIKTLEDADTRKAARECMVLLRAGLTKAIEEARRQVDVAIRDIDDPKSGKTMFYEIDYTNVYHTHADRPTYKTSTSNANVGTQIAEAIQALAGKSAEPQIDVAKLVAEAVAEATKDLREKVASYEAQLEPVNEAPAVDRKTEIKEKVEAVKKK